MAVNAGATKYATRVGGTTPVAMKVDTLKEMIAGLIESGKSAGIGVDEYVEFPSAADFEKNLNSITVKTKKNKRDFVIPVVNVKRYYIQDGKRVRENNEGVFNLRKLMRTCYSDDHLGGIKALDSWAERIRMGEDIIDLVAGKTLHGVWNETDKKFLQDFQNGMPQGSSSEQSWVEYVEA